MLSSISFSARRSLFIWWLELDVTPATIDGPTAGNIEFSHKSYSPVVAVPIDPNFSEVVFVEPPAKFLDRLLTVLPIKLCIVLT
jgi:hypothetical protein